VVREPATVLIRAGLAAAALVGWDVLAPHLPSVPTWAEVAGLALISLPLVTITAYQLLPLVPLGLRLLLLAALAVVVAALLIAVDLPGTEATIAKLVAATLVGFALASLLQTGSEAAAIALLIAAVDAYSVAAGPTKVIVEQHREVLDDFTLSLHPIGSSGVAQIGASDIVFLGLFLASAVRLGLRPRATWAAATASFGLTMALSYAFDAALPALPLLSLGFLAANADLLWARRRGKDGSPERE
jgi:hypothetical protein